MTSQVVPEAAIEAAAIALYFDEVSAEFPAEHPESRDACLRAARKILEAAAPLMLAEAWDAGREVGWDDCGLGDAGVQNPYRGSK